MAALHQVFHVQRNQRGLELAIGADIARGVAARIVVQKQQNVDCGLWHARFFAQRAHLSGIGVLKLTRKRVELGSVHHQTEIHPLSLIQK